MNKQKHTNEPWRIEKSIGAPMIVAGEFGSIVERRKSTYREIAQVQLYMGSEDSSLAQANAERIITCVNFLKGLPTSWLEENSVEDMGLLEWIQDEECLLEWNKLNLKG